MKNAIEMRHVTRTFPTFALQDVSLVLPTGCIMGLVGANGAGVQKVYEELKAAGVKELTLKLYEGGRHEMFNEINREEVWADLAAWLDSKA